MSTNKFKEWRSLKLRKLSKLNNQMMSIDTFSLLKMISLRRRNLSKLLALKPKTLLIRLRRKRLQGGTTTHF
jgi:hypothetical protein